MATWIAHLRIADKILNEIKILSQEDFIVGNIGPDCGVPNEDWSQFSPPTEISHWRKNDSKKIAYEDFYNQYCTNNKSDFYFGYYIHLFTDHLWGEIIYKKKKAQYKNELELNADFIWLMKEDWYDLDKVYLNENILNSYEIFKRINAFENKYFDFYPDNAFTRQIQYITNFYESRDRNITRDFKYLHKSEMDSFVEEAVQRILKEIKALI